MVCCKIIGYYDLIVVNGDVIVVEIKLMEVFVCEVCLKNVFVLVCDNYDFIFIDCLFFLNFFIINVMVVVDFVLVFM